MLDVVHCTSVKSLRSCGKQWAHSTNTRLDRDSGNLGGDAAVVNIGSTRHCVARSKNEEGEEHISLITTQSRSSSPSRKYRKFDKSNRFGLSLEV